MTTSIFNAAAAPAVRVEPPAEAKPITREAVARRHTFASRLAFLSICVAIILTTLAYGTVHYWALAVFALSAAALLCFWSIDAFMLRSAQISLNPLQLPLLGMIAVGLFQLLPLRPAPATPGLPLDAKGPLSLDQYSTRLVVVQVACLFIYFAATLIFTDSPRRLRALVRTITIFGFLLAMFGLMQSFTSDGTRVYWFRQLAQSTAFGPFINRHHFAGYMELTIGLPLGLLFSGAIESSKRPLYAFAGVLMGLALIMTNSRGGMISLGAEILFLAVVAGPSLRHSPRRPREARIRAALLRAALAFVLVGALIGAAVAVGGKDAFTRLLGTANMADPTTGRTHFWGVAIDIIKAYPIIGSGLGSYGVIYTQYDSWNGVYRLEQAHNDYLQVLSDGGIVGGVLGLAFVVLLFRKGFYRRETDDKFKRGVVTGAVAGCFAVLIHSFFDFTLHTTANALLFLILAALATQDSRVDTPRRRRRRDSTGPANELPATDSRHALEPAKLS